MDSLWGWEWFFDELAAFMRDLNRQVGCANESYCEYAVERLEICIQSVSSPIDHLRTRPAHINESDTSVAARYSVHLTELLQCLRGLYMEWQGYVDRDGYHPIQLHCFIHQVLEEDQSL